MGLKDSRLRIVTLGAVCWLFLCVGGQVTHPAEVGALKAVRRSLNDPINALASWNKGDPCKGNWRGVFCRNSTYTDGYLHVVELHLLNINLSGVLAPELGQLSELKILDFMWNQIGGSIPKEIGDVKTLTLLLLNGNKLSGPLPDELGYLPVLDRIQIDQNQISGPLPKSFANLNKTKHFHMNNNSISGQIPPELSRLPSLVHFLLDNNNLSGYIPPQIAELPNLRIFQVDNNNFSGSLFPSTFAKTEKLLKLSLRNCGLQGNLPDFSEIPQLLYLDLSGNELEGPIPTNKLSSMITTIDLSSNKLNGSIPSNFSDLPSLQKLSLANNLLSGSVPSSLWSKAKLIGNQSLILDFENNRLTNITSIVNPPVNITVVLKGNPLCGNSNLQNLTQFCGVSVGGQPSGTATNMTTILCGPQSCPVADGYEFNAADPIPCSCAAPLRVGYRLKSPGIYDFVPYKVSFEEYITSGLGLKSYQLTIDSFLWEKGPRLRMYLKFFPYNSSMFNTTEIARIRSDFTGWRIPDNDIFGPYELLNFTLLKPYVDVFGTTSKSGTNRGALAGIVVGTFLGAFILCSVISVIIIRRRYMGSGARRRRFSRIKVKIDGLKSFAFSEMAQATRNFDNSSQVGIGGYGKVYKGILEDGTLVAIKRAEVGSLQGSREFFTEIEILSRLHHRNLVSLVGFCDEGDEQMLVYEFMPNGTLRDHLSGKWDDPLSFSMRLNIALGSAKGILYLHAEADPPIFHRDVKATNILLDSNFIAKVADFGLSRLAPVPDNSGTTPSYVSTIVKGTPGYLDPEYFLTHKLTDKSDVYSLGVVFLELLTGLLPISQGKNLVREVHIAYQSGMVFSTIDRRMGSYPPECVEMFMVLALRCCEDETNSRPSMAEVVRELENISAIFQQKNVALSSSEKSTPARSTPAPSSLNHSTVFDISSDVSGSDLRSGVIPTVGPR
ncbi:leucine-rich repeat protein kinase family protein [Wolffia australiana]